MHSTDFHRSTTSWLAANGVKALEALIRAIIFHPSAPILIVDDDNHCQDASMGASKLLGLPRGRIIGASLYEFLLPGKETVISEHWRAFLEKGEQEGNLPLMGPDGNPREVEYTAKANVLPARHLLVLRDNTGAAQSGGSSGGSKAPSGSGISSWLRDYGLFLLHADGQIAAWYAGAERLYGYDGDEAIGQHVSMLYADKNTRNGDRHEGLKRTGGEGPSGNEGWHLKKDGSRFWANVITLALRDENGNLRGLAGVARDFSDRYEKDKNLRRGRAGARLIIAEHTVAGIVSGEFERIPDANSAFLDLVGYSREDLLAGRLRWPDITPPEYLSLDELAHEEVLRLGNSAPFEKELIRKDGTRVKVSVATAVLKLSPFQWITFVQNPRDLDRLEKVHEEVVEVTHNFAEIVGSSTPMQRVMGQVEVVAPTGATVFIQGETGTGKELIARAIHRASPRREFPFVTLNCAAIPTGLLESELFGHERGAFTGALAQKIGRFEMANRGTLFLDEVGDMPLDLQPKLLRALQEKSIERLGGTKTIPIDVRLVAATNRNLTEMMEQKLFRSDLYYRLRVFPITTPPLRDRPEDIPSLVRHFAKKYGAKMDRQIDTIPSETMDALVNWSWPGNVRELENFIERSVVLSPGPVLRSPIDELRGNTAEPVRGSTLEQMERDYILSVLRETGGVVSAAAERLGIPRTTLNAMMKKLDISRPNF
ncbi:MAG: sigma 54-interacting transcriptional regulator [Bryobacteraceae bacterium]